MHDFEIDNKPLWIDKHDSIFEKSDLGPLFYYSKLNRRNIHTQFYEDYSVVQKNLENTILWVLGCPKNSICGNIFFAAWRVICEISTGIVWFIPSIGLFEGVIWLPIDRGDKQAV